jgi:hypothetical protein
MGRVHAAMTFAAAFVVCWFCLSAGPSRAADDDESRAILFSGRDLWRNGVFAYGGFLLAPGGFEQDGFLLKLLLSGGLYRYVSGGLGGEQVIGAEAKAQVLPGVRIKRGDLEAKFYFGLDYEEHRLWPDDPSNNLRGRALGLTMAVDLWWEPTPNTMAAMDGSISTIATNHAARAAFGWRVIDDQFYFGPEIAVFASDGYRHLRLGGHFTSMKTGQYEWSAAGGWARDSDGRSSPYVRLGVMQRL